MLSEGSSASKIKRKIAIRGTIELKLGDDCPVIWVGLIFICMIIMPSIFLFLAPSGAEGGNPIVTVVGGSQDDLFGWNVSSAGDVNGDGFDDIIVGAPGYDNNRGRAYIFYGGDWFSGALFAGNANVTINGGAPGDRFGWDVSGTGDFNKDGHDDVIVGAPGNSGDTGAVYIYYGNDSMPSIINAIQANITFTGEGTGDAFGASVSGTGDVDADGYDDLIVGAPKKNGNTGKAYIFFGNGSNPSIIDAIDAKVIFWGQSPGDRFGFSVSEAGNVNKDNYADVIIGAPGKDRAYIFFGGDPMNTWLQTTQADFGSAVTKIHINTTNIMGGEAQLETFHNIKAMASYFDGSNPPDTPEIPKNRTWNQQVWNGESDAYSVGTDANRWFVVKSGTVRKNEKVLAISDAGLDLIVQISDGLSWGPVLEIPDVIRDDKYRGFDVAYESQSGDALLAYFNNTSPSKLIPKYRVWNGSEWSAENDAQAVGTADIHWVVLASNPLSDEILMVTLDRGNKDIYAQVWDGSTWGNVTVIETQASRDDCQCFDVIYEQQSGYGMIVWGGDSVSNKNLNYRRWKGDYGNWSEPQISLVAAKNQVNWVKLAADPNTDHIILGTLDNGREIYAQIWDGFTWSPQVNITGNAERNSERCFDVAWEAKGDKEGLIVYGINDHRPAYRNITGTIIYAENFVLDALPPDNGRKPNWIILKSDPQSDDIMLMYLVDDGGGNGGAEDDIGVELWNGSGWGYPQRVEFNSTRDDGQHFDLAYTDTSGYLISTPYDSKITGPWGRISWGADISLGTTLKIRTRTSSDSSTWGPWSGWYKNGDRIMNPEDRWIQYQAWFETTNVTLTPVLYDVAIELNRANLTINGTQGEGFGWSVSNAGDLDNDGYDEVIIGAPQNNSGQGAAYILNGLYITAESAGDRYMCLTNGDSANVTLTGESSRDQFGYSVSSAGYSNNDGYCDVMVGAPNASANGSVYVFFGAFYMNPCIHAINANWTLMGENTTDRFGWSVSWTGNVSGGTVGYDEIVISAPFFNNDGEIDTGKAYVYHLYHQPELLINGYVDNEHQDVPSGAQVNIKYPIPGNNATWWIIVENDGNLDDTFDLNIVSNMLLGWTWEMRANDTWSEINDGDSISLAPGERKNCSLNISSPITAVNFDESWITIAVTSQNDTSKKDSVKAIARAIDITPPEIIDTTSGSPTTGDPFTITATVADNVMLYEVHLYYWLDLYGGGTDGPYNISMEPSYSKTINVPSNAVVLHYNISANDTSCNWNETGATTISVQDNDLPEVMDTTAGSPVTGDTFTITGVALDNVDISKVHLYYWFDLYGGGTDGPYNVTMDPAYSKNIDAPVNAVTLHYNISANDTSGNWNEIGEIVIAILDDELPKIIDTTSGSPTTGDIFTITATLTDNVQVDSVHLYYWFETTGGPIAPLNMTMDDLGGGNYGYDVNMPSIALVLHYKITANDTSNNWNETGFFSPIVVDNDLPAVIDTIAGIPKTGESISITATVTDNIGVDAVHLYYWFDLFGGGTDGPYNISMDPGYSRVINVPFDAVVLYYNISANDTSNNWNEIGEATLGVQDNDLPLITDTTFGTPTTGESFIITAIVSDNIEIGEVHLYYWFDLYGGGIDGPFNVTMDPDYTKGINVPMDAIGLHYNISANDSSHNWNETEEVVLKVRDNAPPWITDTTTGQPTTGEAFIISATAADNIALGEIHLYYWFETMSGFSTATNATMNNLSGGDYDLLISIPTNGLVLHYNLSGNDTSNNWNEIGENTLDIIDNDSPLINDISAEPSPQGVFGQINITVNITDDIGVSAVWINITHPNGNWINVSMIMANGNMWYHNDIYIEPGDCEYIIWVDDTSGNLNSSTINQFTITPPTVDYIQIRTQPNGVGEVVNTKVYDLGDIDYYYASGYNLSSGYLSEVEVNWVSNNEDSVTLDPPYGSSTTFTAKDVGIGTVFAIFGAIQNQTTFEVVAPQVPEIVGDVPDIDLNEDFSLHNIDLSQYASDPQDSRTALKWFLSGIDNSVIATAGENQTGNHIISFISKENMYANMEVTYWLVDSDGNKASQQAWVNVSPVNDPPKIANCPDVFVRFDSPYPFDYVPYISDIDNMLSELTLTCYDTSHSTVNGFVVTYNYPEDMVGEEVYVTLRVSDGASSDSGLIMITITSDYPPVTVDRISDVTLFENETKLSVFDLDEFIMDPDGDSLYMSYGYTHLNITIHSNHTVDMSALGEWNGVEKVTFRAEDPIGAIVEQTINVTVIPVNDPPAIKPLPNLKVHHDHNYTFDLYWYISDNDNDIEELTIHTSNPDNVTVCGTQITLNYPKDWEGQQYPYSVPLTVYASDGMETAFRVTTVIVDDDYPPKILYLLDDLVFYEDEYVINIYDLDDYFIDNDSYTIFYTSGNVNIDVTIHENHTVDFFAHPNWFGYEYITIRATDDEGAFVEDTILVTVLPINDAPSIADIPPQIGVKGRVWTLDLVDYISDVDNVLDDLIVSVNGTYVTLVGNVLIFEYPENITEDTIWISVSDGELETTISVSVIIEEPHGVTPEDVPWLLYLFLGILIAFFGGILLTRIRFFTVEDLLLITRGGILMVHAGRKIEGGKEDRRDKDIVASMFVAVQEFVKDAFANEEGEALKRMDYGDRKVLIYLGDSLLLAAFISGQESNSLYQKMRDFVEDVEERYEGSYHQGEVLIERLPGVEAMLHSLLEGSYKKGAWKKRKLNTNPLEEKSYQNNQNPPKF